MNAAARIGAFLAVLVVTVAVAAGVGRAVGPVDVSEPEHEAEHTATADHGEDSDGGADEHGGHAGAAPAASTPGGLMVSEGGYTLALDQARAPAGEDVPVTFAITGPDGEAVTAFDVQHDKRLHLIAVRRDQAGFQHVHPTLAADGTWTATLDLTPGPWRVFADFKATGADPLTLGADLTVPGDHQPVPVAEVTHTAVVDDYNVTVAGDLVPGQESQLVLSVEREGAPVTDLEPYLAAYGHLVALREGDLAYLHVHPEGTPGDGVTPAGPDVVFSTSVPSAGRYHLYLDFQHDGVVRTAHLVLAAGEPADGPTDGPADEHGDEPADEHGDEHGH